MQKVVIFLFALCLTAFNSGFAHVPKHACGKQAIAIDKSIESYLDSHQCLKYHEIDILWTECVRNFAAAKLHPKQPVTDDALVYLQKIKNHWQVLSLGTDFDEDLLKKLPKELRYQNQ